MERKNSAAAMISYEALMRTWEVIQSAIQSTLRQSIPLIVGVYAELQMVYRAEGAPYGDSNEGLLRWLDDLAAMQKGVAEREIALARNEMLADAHRLGAVLSEAEVKRLTYRQIKERLRDA